MKQKQQYRVDSFGRVGDFVEGHAGVARAIAESEAYTQLAKVMARIAVLGTEQGTADLVMAGQISRERVLVAELKHEHMEPISTFARARLRGVPDFAALIHGGSARETKDVVHAARAIAEAAAPHTAALIRGGFPADTIAQLTAAADAVSVAAAERANTKVNRTAATKGIAEAILDGREAVAMLHALISKQFARDPALLAGWHTARRVVAKPGVPRGTAGKSAVPVASASATTSVA
jgi:hypothetical protein